MVKYFYYDILLIFFIILYLYKVQIHRKVVFIVTIYLSDKYNTNILKN